MKGGSGEVVRSRLLPELAGRFTRRLTLVEAGPGYGKSTLVGQAVREASSDPGTADVAVRVPPTGWDAAALAVELGRALRARAAGTPDAAGLVEAVWAGSPIEICLVVDDVQWLGDDAVRLLDEVLDGLPTNGHLLLVGRRIPDLAAARHLRDVVHLDEPDLAFDTEEISTFAAMRGIEPDELTRAGWPALLELEWTSGRWGAINSLIDDAVVMIEAQRLAHCRRLALLDLVDDDIATRLVGERVTAAALFDGVPLATVDDDGRVRLHELVRGALTRALDDETRRAAHSAVATALEARDEDHRAVHHRIAADDLDGLRRIARRFAADVHLGQPSVDRRRLATEFRRVLGDDPAVDVVEAAHASLDDPAAATRAVQHALGRARTAGDAEFEALCLVRLADLAYNAADVATLHEAVDGLDRLARSGSAAATRLRHLPQIWVRALTDRHADAVRYIAEARNDPALDPPTRDLLDFYRVIHLGYTGHVRAALKEAEALRSMPGGVFANRLAGFEWVQRWHLGEMTTEDLPHIVGLVDHIDELGETHLFAEGAATTALFHASFGDVTTARSLTERALEKAHRLPPTAWAHHTIAQARAVLAVFDGDEELAAELLRAAVPEGGITALPRHVYGATATLVYVLCPSTRTVWESDRPGPDHVLRRDIARALVALRERHDPAPAAQLPWTDAHLLWPWAFEPHLAELAIAAIAAGNDHARATLDVLHHDPHEHLARLSPALPERVRVVADDVVRLLPRRPTRRIEIEVFGETRLLVDGRPCTDEGWIRRQRVRDMLLLLVHHRSIERARLAATMWPDKSDDAASRNLRFTLNQLSNVLEPDRSPAEPTWFVRTTGSRLDLTVDDRLLIDVDRFDEAVRDATAADRAGAPHRALDRLLVACELYGGDYLAGASDPDWGYYVAIDRRGTFVRAACRAAELLLARSDVDRASELAVLAASAEPDNEPAQRTLAATLLAAGRPGAARDVVAALLARLADLGMSPDERTARLAARLRPTS